MPQFQRSLARILVIGVATAVAPAVHADPGIQVGARSSIQLLDDEKVRHQNAPSVGAEARFSFELSPLVVALTFDHFFVRDRTLFQVGANALYDLPVGRSFLFPYVGAGLGVTRFAAPEAEDAAMGGPSDTRDSDSNGARFGLNLAGGLRFEHVDLPLLRPFTQVTVSLGPIDLLTVGGGVLFELDGR